MALHFGKRENDIGKPLGGNPAPSRYGSPAAAAANPAAGTQPAAPEPAAPATPAAQPHAAGSGVPAAGGSKLIVGPNIKLKGVEITDCDTLLVEGLVEATMDSRVMQIAEQGAFKGTAEIDIAEIHGAFDGDLTVRQKLVIHATGKVSGKVRYGKVVIEEGGQLSGDIGCHVAAGKGASGQPAMALAA